jgi:O-antigen ligase
VTLERAQLALAAALAATIPVSIFASELFLALSFALFAFRLARGRARLPRTAADAPLVAFAVWTLLSASFASEPARSHESAKKLLLFTLFYVALEVLRREGARARLRDAALLGGLAQAALMVAQHHFLGFDELERRPQGFLGHYMSAAGVTMAVLLLAAASLAGAGLSRPRPRPRDTWLSGAVLAGVAALAAATATGSPAGTLATRLLVAALGALAAAVALSRREPVRSAARVLPLAALPLAAWALVVSQTRGAWLGALAGLLVLALLRAPRVGLLVALAALALVVARPAALRERLTVRDASSVDRYYMWQAGLDMVLDKPVFGQGPGMILATYPSYRWPEAPNPLAPHLHNNPLQVAAERGLPGLAFFLWWAGALLLAAWRSARGRKGPDAAAAAGALAVLVAAFVSGLVEYNFGDSEVLMLVLLVAAVPFAGAQRPAAA